MHGVFGLAPAIDNAGRDLWRLHVSLHHVGEVFDGANGDAAAGLPMEKRGIFLGRLVAQLQLRGSHFTTADLDDAVRLALKGLIQKSAA